MTAPTVAIEQGAMQADPTNTLAVWFSVQFSEPVSGFGTEDIAVGGTAPGTPVASVSGSGASYEVAVDGITNTGSVVLTIGTGAAVDIAGNPSLSATSTDNEVAYKPWQNVLLSYDVNGVDGVTAVDVLLIIDYINANPGQSFLPPATAGPRLYYDVNGDGRCEPVDVLNVIDYINNHQPVSAEGEMAMAAGSDLAPPSLDIILRPMALPVLAINQVLSMSTAADGRVLMPSKNESGREASMTRNLRDSVLWSLEAEGSRSTLRRTVGAAATASQRMVANRLLCQWEDLFSSWEDVLPDLAADVERAWHS
jgi:hypothetical protein